MMKLRMVIARCCCGPEPADGVHSFFTVGASNASLVLKSDPDSWITDCTSGNLTTLGITHDEHFENWSSFVPELLFGWAIQMSATNEDRAIISVDDGSQKIQKVTPIDGPLGTPEWTFTLFSLDVVNSQYKNQAEVDYLAEHSNPERFIFSGDNWLSTLGLFGSLWLASDVSNTPSLTSATRAERHWNGLYTPELLATSGGTEAGARFLYVNIRNGQVSSRYSAGWCFGSRSTSEVYCQATHIAVLPNNIGPDITLNEWWPDLKDYVVAAWSDGVGSSLSKLPTKTLLYDLTGFNDVGHGNVVPVTKSNFNSNDLNNEQRRFKVTAQKGCVSADGASFFCVLAMTKESTIPAVGASDSNGLVNLLVLYKISLASMGVSETYVLQAHSAWGIASAKTVRTYDPSGTVGVMVATPAGGVMFNRADWENPLNTLGIHCFDSNLAPLWDLNTEGGYVTHDGSIYISGHPDAVGGGPFDPNTVSKINATTGAIVQEYSGAIEVANRIESIEGPIHLR